ncbi:MAG: hypothetical protein RL740_440 [Actinomycetota bacterium]
MAVVTGARDSLEGRCSGVECAEQLIIASESFQPIESLCKNVYELVTDTT